MKVSGVLADLSALKPLATEMSPFPPPETWVVVADGEKALFFRKYGQTLQALGEAEASLTVLNQGMNAAAGAMTGPGFGGRHRFDPHDASLKHDQVVFARGLADLLEHSAEKKYYERLILVAEPRMLGFLREALPRSVRALVYGEIDRDLTPLPEAALRGEIAKLA